MWPLEDELEVRLMIELIRHVTGSTHLPPPRVTIWAFLQSHSAVAILSVTLYGCSVVVVAVDLCDMSVAKSTPAGCAPHKQLHD